MFNELSFSLSTAQYHYNSITSWYVPIQKLTFKNKHTLKNIQCGKYTSGTVSKLDRDPHKDKPAGFCAYAYLLYQMKIPNEYLRFTS